MLRWLGRHLVQSCYHHFLKGLSKVFLDVGLVLHLNFLTLLTHSVPCILLCLSSSLHTGCLIMQNLTIRAFRLVIDSLMLILIVATVLIR